MRPMARASTLAGIVLLLAAGGARADVHVGVLLSATGPAASIGIAEKNAVTLGPTEIAGQKVNYIQVDEASDTTAAVAGMRKLVQEGKVDVVIGTTTTPGAFAITPVAVETGTPVISMAPTNALVSPVDERRRWIFKTTTNDEHEAAPLFRHMRAAKSTRLALIGFADPYGDAWAKVADTFAGQAGIQLVASERFARTDTSVVGQVLKIVSARPDAVLVAASGAPAALPVIQLRERGFRGAIYGTLGATFGDFRKLAGARGEGILVPLSPAIGAESFPEDYPARTAALDFIKAYEAKFGADSRNIFAGSAWDALLLIQHAVPAALKTAKPGTAEFREALRGAIEGIRGMPGSRGVYNLGPQDHTGLDEGALLLGRLDKGRWVLVRE